MKKLLKGKSIKDCKPASGSCGSVYGIGLVGALVYFLQHSYNFSSGLLGILKAFVWPAVLVYKLLDLLF